MSDSLTWYSLNEDLGIEDQPPVDVDGALAVARRYYANADKKWEMGEEAIAATMFGIRRDPDTFIEICVNGSDSISYRFEMPRKPGTKKSFLGLILGVFQHEMTIESWGELEEAIRDFYSLSPQSIRERLARKA